MPSKQKAEASKGGPADRKRKGKETAPEPKDKQPARKKPAVLELLPVAHPSHLKVAADLFLWGDSMGGQLGLGEDVDSKARPAAVEVDGSQVLQVACGGMHTVVIVENGSIYTFGVNDEGALGRETEGEPWDGFLANQATSSNAVRNAQDAYFPAKVDLPEGAGKIVQVTAGDSHSAALTEMGAVYAWGSFRNSGGVYGFSVGKKLQLTPALVHEPRSAADQIVQIASGADHILALTASGEVFSWGTGQQGQLGRVGERLNERTMEKTLLVPAKVPIRIAGGGHGHSRKSPHIIDVSCGNYSSFAVTDAHEVIVWGLNNVGQLALPTEVLTQYAPVLVESLAGTSTVSGGQHHSIALGQDGHLRSFGKPTYGGLGRRDVDENADTAMPDPMPVDNLPNERIGSCAAGIGVSGCVTEEGKVWLWGSNVSNQLGKGENNSEDDKLPVLLRPTPKVEHKKIVQLALGGQHTAVLAVPNA